MKERKNKRMKERMKKEWKTLTKHSQRRIFYPIIIRKRYHNSYLPKISLPEIGNPSPTVTIILLKNKMKTKFANNDNNVFMFYSKLERSTEWA